MDRRKQFKKKSIGFGIVEDGKILRAINCLERRRRDRFDLFNSIRQINEPSPSRDVLNINTNDNKQATSSKDSKAGDVPDTKEKHLARWRAERELKKKLERQTKRPVFRAGVYSPRFDSVIFLHQAFPLAKPAKSPTVEPRITKATAKKLAMKFGAGVESAKKVGGILRRNVEIQGKKNASAKSFAPQNHKFKPPDSLPCLPLFGQEAVENNDNNSTDGVLEIYFSPYVVAARGKPDSRIEQLENFQLENDLGIVRSEDKNRQLVLDIVGKNLADGEKERTTSYFRSITERELTRLKACCFDWIMLKSNPDLTEDAQAMINQAIGQTQILITKKIEHFKKLIEACENGSEDKPVTCQYLQDFWDMMFIQIEDCDIRFEKLKKLQAKNWIEVPNCKASSLSSIKFDGVCFMVESPQKGLTTLKSCGESVKRISTPSSPPIPSSVSKNRRSALSTIKISQILKPLEIPVAKELDSELKTEYINCGQTPGKSILNKTDITECVASIKKVNFSENMETIFQYIPGSIIDDRVQNVDADIDEYCNSEIEVKEKLDFSNISSSDSEHDLMTETLDSRETDPSQTNCSDKRVTRQNSRYVLGNIGNTETLSENQNIPSTEGNLDNCSTGKGLGKENEVPEVVENIKRRRSTRKNVKSRYW